MNVTLKKIDPVNATVTIDVVKEDYANEVEKSIKNLRKSTIIPGFRKGMVPLSRVRQIHEKSVLQDELNKLIINKLNDWIKEEKLDVLGEPLLSGDEPKTLELDKEDYSVTFDIGLMPQAEFKLSKEDKVPYYSVEITGDMIDEQISYFKANYGSHDSVEEIEEKDLVKGVLTELDENGEPKADGIRNEDAVLMPEYIKNEEEKAKFTGAKLNTTIVFNPHRAHEGNAVELSSFLKTAKDTVENHTGNFSLEIKEITRYKEAEINQELFDKIFEPGTVTSEETFREKIRKSIAWHLAPESDYKFRVDVYKYLKEKVGDLTFPETFMKRYLQTASPEKTPETIDADYRKITEDLKFHSIKQQLINGYKITVNDSEIIEAAQQATREQLGRLRMTNISDKFVDDYVRKAVKSEETVRRLADNIIEAKLTDVFKEKLTLETRTVTAEEFQSLLKEDTD